MAPFLDGQALPGIPTTWALNQSVPEVACISRRLLELHALLGGGPDIDVVWMVRVAAQFRGARVREGGGVHAGQQAGHVAAAAAAAPCSPLLLTLLPSPAPQHRLLVSQHC